MQRQWVAGIVLEQVSAFQIHNLFERRSNTGIGCGDRGHILIIRTCCAALLQHVIELDQTVAVIERQTEQRKNRHTQNTVHANFRMVG